MSNVPSNLRYTAEHEWVSVVDATTVRFGITDFAQAALGDIVFVTLPAVGSDLQSGTACGEVESTKSVSDIYAPVTGVVSAANDAVETSPETLNSDPYGNGWIADVTVADANAAFAALMSADEYTAITSA
jgi:glycine cleavage system H protein